MAGIKIVDLPALGRDLAATDLLELSLAGGTGSRKITGQEIINASKLNVGTTPIINGTAGRLLFQGSGDILQQSGNLFWDNTNGRLGIGTSSPTTIVDIQPPIGGPVLRVARTGGAAVQISASILSTGGFIGTYTASPFILVSNSAERMRLTDTGNVLIGTTTDAGFKLDVVGNSRISGNLRFLNTSDTLEFANTLVRIRRVANGMYLDAFNGFTFFDSTSSLDRVRITQGGNVLINTTTDSGYRLDVNGTARISNATWDGTALLLQGPSPGRALHVLENSLVLFDSPLTMRGSLINFYEPTGLSTATTLGEITSGGVHWSASNVTRILFAASGGVWSGSSKPTKITFSTTNVGNITATEKISIEPSGNLLIGTTTDAGYRLDVNGTARVQGNTTVTGTIGIGLGASFLSLSGAANNNVIQGNQSIEYRSVGATVYRAYHNFTNNSSFIPTVDFIPHVVMGATFAPASGTGSYAQLLLQPTINQTGTANGAVRGFYYSPTVTSVLGPHWAIHTTAGRVRFEGLPTSPTGLNAGDIYNDGGTLKIV